MNQTLPTTLDNPVAVLTDAKTYSEFYARIKAEVSNHVPDLTTEKGRKEIASLAYKVKRSKTAIDDAGKKLNEDARAKINAVDAQRRKIREELETLAAEVRKPLTEWEEAEDARKEAAAADLNSIAELRVVLATDGADAIKSKLATLNTMVLTESIHGEGLGHARAQMAAAAEWLESSYDRAKKHEDDQRELARMRAEQEERARVEREATAKAEAERQAKERAEREASEAKAREERAAETARLAAERAAKIEQERVEREAREAIARAEAETRAIREKAEREDRDRQEEAARERREQQAREADRAHRSNVMGEAKKALMTCGADEETAKKIVLAIVAGEIPHVTLRF